MFSRTNIVLLFFCLCISELSAQTVFIQQNPFYTPESVNAIKFINQTGWAAGNNGMILKTTNGGLNFSQQFFPSNADIIKLSLPDSLNCFAFDDSSCVFRTSNGGANWIKVSSLISKVNDFCFVNQSSGFLASESFIGKTTSSGLNWSFVNPDTAHRFTSVYFLNSQTGFVSSINLTSNYSFIFKTTDSGINWSRYNTSVDAFEISNMYFINAQSGWCTGKRFDYLYAMKTTNGGINWTESHSSVSTEKPNNIYFSSGNTGYITTPLKIIKSTNGGTNWFTFLAGGGFRSSYFINENYFYLGDNYSRIYKSSGSNTNFDTLLGKYNNVLLKIQCIDSLKLWSCGLNSSNWKSTNGGTNWTYDVYSASLSINYTQFADANTGFSIAGRGTVYKTTNFGTNWNSMFDHPGEVYSFNFLNSLTGWAFADNSIFRTVDSGLNWSVIPNTENIHKSFFFDSQNGFGMNNNYLFKTSNSGYNWTQCSPDVISDYSFINSQTGWIVSNVDTTSVIKKTTDGGISWIVQSTIFNNINSIKFLNQNTGYLLTYDKLYRTTNSGTTWKFVSVSKSLRIFGMDILDANRGWLCGDNSLIIKLVNGSAIYVNNNELLQPDFHLYQNYPNPFNSSTSIRFTISKHSHTSLKIYDIQGREVALLLNSYLNPGTHNISFNTNNLPSGIYFYTLSTNNTSITKKLLLIK